MRRNVGTLMLIVTMMASVSSSGCIWYRHWVIRRHLDEVKKDVREARTGWGGPADSAESAE